MEDLQSIKILESWAREAVGRHGDNWAEINKELEHKLASLNEGERAQMLEKISKILSSSDPRRAMH